MFEFTFQSVIFVLFLHFLADFALQTHWQASNKSTNEPALLKHVSVYTIFVTLGIFLVYGLPSTHAVIILLFPVLVFVLHFVTDLISSKEVSRLFKEDNYHDGFVVIGMDQLAHFIQLFGLLALMY